MFKGIIIALKFMFYFFVLSFEKVVNSISYLMVNLAIADLILIFGNLPFVSYNSTYGDWCLGQIGCNIYGSLGSLFGFGTGRLRVGDETLTVPKYGGVLVGPDQLRQVFNDTDAEVLWLIIGAPEELEFLQGSKSKMDLSLVYPTDPTQLPKELAGVQWPPKS